MTDQQTTFKVGFDTNVEGLKKAQKEINALVKSFDKLSSSVSGASKKAESNQKTIQSTPNFFGRVLQRMSGSAPGGKVLSMNQAISQELRGGLAGKVGGAGVKGVTSLAGGFGLGGVGMLAGAGMLAGGAMLFAKGIVNAKDYRIALDGVYKQLNLSIQKQAEFSYTLEGTAHALGMTRAEMAPLQKQYLSMAGGVQGATRMQEQIIMAGGLSKGFGMDVRQGIGQFGGLAQAGAFGHLAGPGGLQMRDMAMLIADAVSRGRMKGREGELVQSVDSLVGVQMQMLTRPENVSGIIGAIAGLSGTDQPGLKGLRGAQLLGQVSAGIRNPGGGDFGEYFAYQAFGGGDYYKFKKRQEEGAFGEGNNLKAILDHFQKTMKDSDTRHFAMSRVLGISIHQAQALEQGFAGMGGGNGLGLFNRLRDAAGGGQIGAEKLERLDYEKLPILAELNKTTNRSEIKRLLQDERIQLAPDKIEKVMQSADPRFEALKTVLEANLKKTQGEEIQQSLADLKDVATGLFDKALGVVVPILSSIDEGVQVVSNFFGGGKKREGRTGKLGDPGSVIDRFSGDQSQEAVPEIITPTGKTPFMIDPSTLKSPEEWKKQGAAAPEINQTINLNLNGTQVASEKVKGVGNGTSSKTINY